MDGWSGVRGGAGGTKRKTKHEQRDGAKESNNKTQTNKAHTSVTTAAAPSTTSAVTAVGEHGDYEKKGKEDHTEGKKKRIYKKWGGRGVGWRGKKQQQQQERKKEMIVVWSQTAAQRTRERVKSQ